MIHLLGFAGSLRAGSFNRALLRAARELAPEGMEIRTFDLAPIPLYNADLDTDERRPESVVAFKAAVGEADALLIATPEYNYGVPGVLKNAIDWASRPAYRSVLVGKPCGIMGASGSAVGTARAQSKLRDDLYATLAPVLPHPGVLVSAAGKKFDAEGRLTDEDTRGFLRDFLGDFAEWTRRFSAPRENA